MTPPALGTPSGVRQKLHPIAGAIALATILIFWTSTVISEVSGVYPLVLAVKMAVPWGFLLLIPALALTGASGAALSKGRQGKLIAAKQKRMRIIAGNGILVLVPSALFLAVKARDGDLDTAFYAVQAIELAAGAVNAWLLSLNMRDGWKMTARRRQARQSG
ncbi:hypothetical protein ACQKH5_14930 [Hyphomonas sp. NPDC076900]|uniref:hypothetical protein n=1 Tax=unclassified Hyphomonas TaxID=2630699 RepID=UPI003CFFD613